MCFPTVLSNLKQKHIKEKSLSLTSPDTPYYFSKVIAVDNLLHILPCFFL